MEKALLVLLLVAVALVAGVAVAAADSDNAAIIITLDEGCEWYEGELVAGGSVHYVEVKNGKWNLACIGNVIEGPLPEEAIVNHSTADDPLGRCYTPFGETYDWQEVYTPSGQSSLVCHGDLSP